MCSFILISIRTSICPNHKWGFGLKPNQYAFYPGFISKAPGFHPLLCEIVVGLDFLYNIIIHLTTTYYLITYY